jgi:hypothetical protein
MTMPSLRRAVSRLASSAVALGLLVSFVAPAHAEDPIWPTDDIDYIPPPPPPPPPAGGGGGGGSAGSGGAGGWPGSGSGGSWGCRTGVITDYGALEDAIVFVDCD